MSRYTHSKFSRRDAILYGLGTAAVSCTGSTFAAPGTDERILVTGAIKGRMGLFAIDPQSGAISLVRELNKVPAGAGLENAGPPDRYEYEDQTKERGLLVYESVAGRRQLRVRNSAGRQQHTIRTRGSVLEAKFSADGNEIAVIDVEDATTRLLIMNANGERQRILAAKTDSCVRGLSWSPCGQHVGVVAFDWDHHGESGMYPAPESHRIDVYAADFSGRRISTFATQSAWLDRTSWTRG